MLKIKKKHIFMHMYLFFMCVCVFVWCIHVCIYMHDVSVHSSLKKNKKQKKWSTGGQCQVSPFIASTYHFLRLNLKSSTSSIGRPVSSQDLLVSIVSQQGGDRDTVLYLLLTLNSPSHFLIVS